MIAAILREYAGKFSRLIGATMSSKSYVANRAAVYKYWLDAFKSPAVAAGLTAQAQGESSFSPTAIGDHGQAFGLQQWHPSRAHAIKVGTGIDLTKLPSLADQLRAAEWELRGPEKHALAQILTAQTAFNAGYLAAEFWERPASKVDYAKRGAFAEQIADYFAKNPVG